MRVEYLFLLGSIFFGASGQLILKYATASLKPINLELTALPHTILKIFTNGWVIAGLLCFAVSMIIWIKVISTMELSRAYPSVSLSYLLVFAFSILLYNEDVTIYKVLGMAVICFGVFLIHR
ncbi:MAG: EamA family transporter [Desulfocucumaceae bacterium]